MYFIGGWTHPILKTSSSVLVFSLAVTPLNGCVGYFDQELLLFLLNLLITSKTNHNFVNNVLEGMLFYCCFFFYYYFFIVVEIVNYISGHFSTIFANNLVNVFV